VQRWIEGLCNLLLTQLCTARASGVLAQTDRFLTFCDYRQGRGRPRDTWLRSDGKGGEAGIEYDPYRRERLDLGRGRKIGDIVSSTLDELEASSLRG
jgi:hypothetical protein